MSTASPSPLSTQHPTLNTPHGGRVLIVDDDENNRALLRDLLQSQGHEVTGAADGEEALAQVAHAAPDVVLLDIMMPRLDGLEVCRRLKGDPQTAPIPILLITALADRQDRLAGIAAGANDFLTKPIDTQDVLLRVRNAVSTKRLYDQLAESYLRLRELEKLRDDLTHMIIHDLRTPLTSLLSGLQTLRVVGVLNPTQRECLELAAQGGDALLAMINNLLDISKMEAGALELAYQDLVPADLIDQAVLQVAWLAQEKRLSLNCDIPEDLPAVAGDADLLRRALVNLLGNAVKFTPTGGTITIAVRFDHDTLALRFAVRDTGEGIPADALQRIFDKFAQVENRQSGRQVSTGLGLTFCKMVVEAHGGRIWAESDPGHGSTFTFTLPLEPHQ